MSVNALEDISQHKTPDRGPLRLAILTRRAEVNSTADASVVQFHVRGRKLENEGTTPGENSESTTIELFFRK